MAPNQSTSIIAVAARVFWIMVGPATLSLLAITIVENHQGWFSARSIAFLVVLALVAMARWLDPLNSYGEPVTPGQVHRYMFITALLGLGVWVAINLLGAYWAKT